VASLLIVYIAWGATYPAIAVLVRTVPPLLGMGARFLVAGVVLAGGLRLAGRRRPAMQRRAIVGSTLVGPWILGSIGLIAIAEEHVEAGLAALVIGSVPLWVLLMERVLGIRRPSRAALLACVAGFGGLAVVVGPGGGGGALGWFAVLIGAAAFEASGEVGGSHVPQITDALWATVVQLGGAGVALMLAGVAAGELSGVDWAAMDGDTVLAFGFLVIVGSVLAYPALVWLLANTPTSTAATYAYVNPVVALVLGAVLLDERVSVAALVGAGIVLGSVVVVVRQDVSA
jgi:drug/metabolite transporter (DMT)-like permease